MSLTDISCTASYTSSVPFAAAASVPLADLRWGAQLNLQLFYFLVTDAQFTTSTESTSHLCRSVFCWYAQIILLLGWYISSRLRTIQHLSKVCSAGRVTETFITHYSLVVH